MDQINRERGPDRAAREAVVRDEIAATHGPFPVGLRTLYAKADTAVPRAAMTRPHASRFRLPATARAISPSISF